MTFKTVSKIFLTGLLAVLPIAVTAYFIFWLCAAAESFFGGIIHYLLPAEFYVTGMGVVAGIGVVFTAGILMMNRFTRQLLEFAESLLEKIPLIQPIYSGLKNISNFLNQAGDADDHIRNVVMVPFGESGVELMGFLMNQRDHALPEAIGSEDRVAVYLPMSYQVGGYTLILPRSELREVDMSSMDALQFILTAGIGKDEKENNNK